MSYFKLQSSRSVDYPPIWTPQLYGGAYADCLYKKNQRLVPSGYRWPPGIEGCRDEPFRYRRGGVCLKCKRRKCMCAKGVEGFGPLPGAKPWRIIEPGMGFRRWFGRVDPPTLPGRAMALKHQQRYYIEGGCCK